MTVLLEELELVVACELTVVVVVPDVLGEAVTVAGELEVDVGGEVAVSDMRTPVRLYAAAQAERDNPW